MEYSADGADMSAYKNYRFYVNMRLECTHLPKTKDAFNQSLMAISVRSAHTDPELILNIQ